VGAPTSSPLSSPPPSPLLLSPPPSAPPTVLFAAPAAFHSCIAAAFLSRAADACSKTCTAAAASLWSWRIAADEVGLGMDWGMEIQLYEEENGANWKNRGAIFPRTWPRQIHELLQIDELLRTTVPTLSFSLRNARPGRPLTNRRQSCRQDGAGSFLQIRQHADGKSPAVVRAKLLGWSKNIFISKTQFAPVVPLFSFPTQGSRQRQLLLPLS
jgi:hypothetical protein